MMRRSTVRYRRGFATIAPLLTRPSRISALLLDARCHPPETLSVAVCSVNAMSISQRLAGLGAQLPPVAVPAGSYVPALRVGGLVFTSGQLPTVDGHLHATGVVGRDVTTEVAAECARVCAMNALAAAASAAGGVDNIERIVKLSVFVASCCDPAYTEQAKVANGASDALAELLGDAGRHARSAVGVAALPLGAPVEVEMIVQVKP